MSFLHESKDGILIEVRVQPRAARSELAGIQDDRLKIRLTAAPVEGEANRECVRVLSKILDIPKSDLEIVKGLKSRLKTILVRHHDAEALLRVFREKCAM